MISSHISPFFSKYLWFAVKQHPSIKSSSNWKLLIFLYDLPEKIGIIFSQRNLMPIKVTSYLLQILLFYFHKSFDVRLEKNFKIPWTKFFYFIFNPYDLLAKLWLESLALHLSVLRWQCYSLQPFLTLRRWSVCCFCGQPVPLFDR